MQIMITRAMLVIAAIAILVFRDEGHYLNLFLSAALLIAAIFIRLLMVRFRVSKLIVLSAAAIILLISTHSIAFALILVVFGHLAGFLFKRPIIAVNERGVTIKKTLGNSEYGFSEFSNIILKDMLLTLDFKNNKLLQLTVDEATTAIDENAFNASVAAYLSES